MNIVKVKCFDMTYSSGVWSRKDISNFGLVNLEIVGWLVEDREDCIVIAKEYNQIEDEFRHLSAIPKVCIKELTKLRARGNKAGQPTRLGN